MGRRYARQEIIERMRVQIESGRIMFAPNCGCGLTAKLQEMGGADIVIVTPTSYWRMKGIGGAACVLSTVDANQAMYDLAPEVSANLNDTPLLAMMEVHNPLFPHNKMIKRLLDEDVSGVCPLMAKGVGAGYEEFLTPTGMGWQQEVDFIHTAHEMDVFTFACAFTPEEARILAEAGADVICSHVGPTIGGLLGAVTKTTLDDAVRISQKIFDAARAANKDVILFTHGGPISTPADAGYVYARTDMQGFMGGSAAERLPIEKAIVGVTKEYKSYSK